jgi:hypothetical protein
MIAYLMPNDADEPRDGLSFIAWAPTEEEAIAKLKGQLARNYEFDGSEYEVIWYTENPAELPHVVVRWIAKDDDTECHDFYWLHLADD